ncbi:ATP-binding cassette domain-containing protein [Helicobacter saguini]|uniref:ATP-binding cassette domain-containing protein n=1 Tax=Helicobacter saguini TaxID=1548018 RepID=A0A347W454_9HELI|nr:amino acid ABC transporter ATP-binding protein [Helicobacter saguini]MWV61980.1 ATP-binding cassette domain-containing protein [Helicobacter saguini]MWV67346.1 ATP-binding cassette domain-containing protein [Helicobacter saguini]MWV69697.1 ATP-binding cassette domain-containing protein [Helicobacter saguini]MWV73085.1 ATP-binding cassette domain-containing protein [Helicobacter saguini]TLD95546.1 amino acid ABC transporter ATP-binding protein [Helicobacter saguini]
MIEIRDLNMSFGKKQILKNINLDVGRGEIIAIIGPSGAGKSSLLRTINLLETPQSGTIKLENMKLNYAKFTKFEALNLRRKSAMVFQSHNLFINKNCLQNVTEALKVVQKMDSKAAESAAFAALEKVGMASRALSYTHELSGGQAQRVGIARALALNLPIMLFDEPTSALDPELVSEVLETIREIKGKTMLIVTHELNFARAIADKIVFMDAGEILQISPPREFFGLESSFLESNNAEINLQDSNKEDSRILDSKQLRIKQFLSKMQDYKKYV